jgi:threonine/homoserine/homoserine lactone efflux protein
MSLFLLYLTVSFFYIISPGPAIFLAISNGMSVGLPALVLSSLGNIVGLFLLSVVSILGLGTIVMTSSLLFFIVKLIGACYLVYLGIKQFMLTRQRNFFTHGASNEGVLKNNSLNPKSLAHYFLEGFFLAVTNPKPILFFIAIFPQFLIPEEAILPQFLLMTLSFMVLSFLSLYSYGYMGKSVRIFFTHDTYMKYFHRVTGGLFIGMGITLLGLKSS